MQYASAYIALFAATTVLSLPLNINMGAYSPALVVGDGAIGFEGAAGENQVASLINTLQGAAIAGAANNGAAAPAAVVPAPAGTTAAITQPQQSAAPAAEGVTSQSSDILPQGMGKIVNTRELTAEELEELEEAQEEAAITDNTKRALTAEELEELEEAQEEAAITDAIKKRTLTAEDEEELDEEIEAEDNEKRGLSLAVSIPVKK